MEFKKSVIELIKTRTSSRTYDNNDIEKHIYEKLNDYIIKVNNKIKIKGRIILANNNVANAGAEKKLGTYGVIKGANIFIAGVLDKEEKNTLEFGYLFEKIILFATDLGLATCWLGGTFNKNDFKQNLNLHEDEFIPIISPAGIKKEKPRVFESAMRAVAGSNTRKPWNELFFQGTSLEPLNELCAGAYSIPLEMVRIGPSASNKQPWRIIKDDNAFHFFLCRTKGYGVMAFDMQKNDIGIAKCHFELTANELGLKGKWQDLKKTYVSEKWEYIISWSME